MNILKDMEIFVRVVQCDGLAAAARELNIAPSNVTKRIQNLESHYQVKLLTRTTRRLSLTNDGHEFYKDCLRILESMNHLENKLKSKQEAIAGSLRISAPSDMGQQHVAPILNDFVRKNPEVKAYLNLSDAVTDIAENNIDFAIRCGISSNSNLIGRKIAKGRRVLCASPNYLEKYGIPKKFSDLKNHRCLTMVQNRTPLSKWYFDTPAGEKSILINPSQSCDDGAQIRRWALDGAGIALKSIWDVIHDINAARLITVLDDFNPDFQSKKLSIGSDWYIVYQDRKYMPSHVREFMNQLLEYFEKTLISANYSKVVKPDHSSEITKHE